MRTKHHPHIFAILLLALGVSSCLSPPGYVAPDDVAELTMIVVQRTRGYMDADTALGKAERSERKNALFVLEGTLTIDNPKPITREHYRAISELAFSVHDAYVRADPKLLDWQRDSDLLATEILRSEFWPPGD